MKFIALGLLQCLVAPAVIAAAQPSYAEQVKLTGTYPRGFLGASVALSYDGNTLIAGNPFDSGGMGGAYVYSRTGNTWTQQARLAAPSLGAATQGQSVALSDDGNTALVSGPTADGGRGAVWVWVRSGSAWSIQQMLSDPTAASNAFQGLSVALAGDGNTAVVGAPQDGGAGAVGFYTRLNGVWTLAAKRRGGNLLNIGSTVAISRDGSRAAAGAPYNGSGPSSIALYDAAGPWSMIATYTNQLPGAIGTSLAFSGIDLLYGAPPLNAFFSMGVGFGSSQVAPFARLGESIAVSADGAVAVVNAPDDNNLTGSAVVYKPFHGFWTEQPGKLAGADLLTGRIGTGGGPRVAISGDGRTVAVASPSDGANAEGAVWIFTEGPDLKISTSWPAPISAATGGGTISLNIANIGTAGATSPVTVTDTFPAGLSPVMISGTGWNCIQPSGPCSRSDVLAAGSAYPPITVSAITTSTYVTSALWNTASVSGGDEINPTNDSSTVNLMLPQGPDLSLSLGHLWDFSPGNAMGLYQVQVINHGTAPTTGPFTVLDVLPAGLTMAGLQNTAGWDCSATDSRTIRCTSYQTLLPGARTGWIGFIVNVAPDATSLTNSASVSGGGDVNPGDNIAYDPTIIHASQIIYVTVGTNQYGVSFSVDGVTYSSPQFFQWAIGSTHTIATTSPQYSMPYGIYNYFSGWSDGGAISHTVTANTDTTGYFAVFYASGGPVISRQ